MKFCSTIWSVKLSRCYRGFGRRWVALAGYRRLARLNAQALNMHLWTWADDVFLPHAAAGDAFSEFAVDQPVWLTHEDDVPNDAVMLMLADGAVHDDLSCFEDVCSFLTVAETALATARADWSPEGGRV